MLNPQIPGLHISKGWSSFNDRKYLNIASKRKGSIKFESVFRGQNMIKRIMLKSYKILLSQLTAVLRNCSKNPFLSLTDCRWDAPPPFSQNPNEINSFSKKYCWWDLETAFQSGSVRLSSWCNFQGWQILYLQRIELLKNTAFKWDLLVLKRNKGIFILGGVYHYWKSNSTFGVSPVSRNNLKVVKHVQQV